MTSNFLYLPFLPSLPFFFRAASFQPSWEQKTRKKERERNHESKLSLEKWESGEREREREKNEDWKAKSIQDQKRERRNQWCVLLTTYCTLQCCQLSQPLGFFFANFFLNNTRFKFQRSLFFPPAKFVRFLALALEHTHHASWQHWLALQPGNYCTTVCCIGGV